MALNTKHIFNHLGKQEYTGDEGSNIVLGQTGVDVLTDQNDTMTAGRNFTIGGATTVMGMGDVKGWVSITALGNSTANAVTATVQVKAGASTYTDIAIQLPVGITLYGPFYKITMTDTNTNGEALYCIRG